MRDDWVKAALSDDSMVVDLLFRLKQSSLSVFRKPPSTFLPQGWGRHQPRSRFAVCANTTGKKDSAATTSSTIRRSPTTPLSWSGGAAAAAASPSDGNFDGHSEPDRSFSDLSRSKDECTNNISSMSKNSGKRKALYVPEPQLKESVHLSKNLKMVSRPVVTHEQQQRVRRQNSKTIKFDTIIRLEKDMVGTSCSPPSMTEAAATATALTGRVEAEKFRSSPTCYVEEQQQQHKRCLIILPDLNTMPAAEGDDI